MDPSLLHLGFLMENRQKCHTCPNRGHNTKHVRVQEVFGQCFQVPGVILGVSCIGPGVRFQLYGWVPSNSAYSMIPW